MAQALYVSGAPTMADYTPTGGNLTAGDVVIWGNMAIIAHKDIANATLGAMAVGGGIYTVTGLTQIDPGLKVYWADSLDKVTVTAAGNIPFGKTVANCTAANATVDVLHAPYF